MKFRIVHKRFPNTYEVQSRHVFGWYTRASVYTQEEAKKWITDLENIIEDKRNPQVVSTQEVDW